MASPRVKAPPVAPRRSPNQRGAPPGGAGSSSGDGPPPARPPRGHAGAGTGGGGGAGHSAGCGPPACGISTVNETTVAPDRPRNSGTGSRRLSGFGSGAG